MSDENNVVYLRGDQKSAREFLETIAKDDELEKVLIVSIYKNGECATGWAGRPNNGEMAYGLKMLDADVSNALIEGRLK